MTTSRSKAAGSAAERVVAAALAGRRVGHDGGPVDVIVDGYLDVQVKTVKTLPSLAAVIGYLEAIPRSDRLRSCVVVTRPGSGKRAVRTITFLLDEFREYHGADGADVPVPPGPFPRAAADAAAEPPTSTFVQELVEGWEPLDAATDEAERVWSQKLPDGTPKG